MTEFLAAVDVGYMDLNAGNIDRFEGVEDGVAVVGKRAGVEDNGVIAGGRFVDGVDERALVVGRSLRDSPWSWPGL